MSPSKNAKHSPLLKYANSKMDLVLVTKPVVLDELQGSHHLLQDDVVEGQ